MMANVNLKTGRIYGVEKETLKYYHEEGHLIFEDKYKYGNFIRVVQDMSFKSIVFIMALYILSPILFLKILLVVILFSNILSEIFEEKWCWDYSKFKINKLGKKTNDERIKTKQRT